MRWGDRIVGIVLGVILGAGIVTAFVFLYSEQTVDAPSISNHRAGTGKEGANGRDGGPPAVATVRVIGGAPPASGPAELQYRKGQLVRLRVVSDASVDLDLLGFGIGKTVPAGQPALISFKASKQGSFPLVVTASHIDVARIAVGGPAGP